MIHQVALFQVAQQVCFVGVGVGLGHQREHGGVAKAPRHRTAHAMKSEEQE